MITTENADAPLSRLDHLRSASSAHTAQTPRMAMVATIAGVTTEKKRVNEEVE